VGGGAGEVGSTTAQQNKDKSSRYINIVLFQVPM
jgi:hypothetical protein